MEVRIGHANEAVRSDFSSHPQCLLVVSRAVQEHVVHSTIPRAVQIAYEYCAVAGCTQHITSGTRHFRNHTNTPDIVKRRRSVF